MKRKICNPCILSNSLTYCGDALSTIGVEEGDKYADVLSKIDNAIQSSSGGAIPTTRSINAGTGLTGGGNLSTNRTIALSTASIDSLNKADTAVQPSALGNYVPTTRTVSAGTGMAGGGALSANQTLSLNSTTISSLSKADTAFQQDNIKFGSTSFTLDGVETTFNIAHGMASMPTSFALTFSDGGNLDFIQSVRTIDNTNIIITCQTPPNGQITVFWQAFM